jgi:DNA polymerase-3 subunit beta
MKFTVLQENLKAALGSLQKAIPSKPQLPILTSVYLQAKGDSLTLAATDLYLGIKSTIPAKVKKEETLVVPGEILKNLIFSFSAGEISFEKKGSSLIVKNGNSQSTLPYQVAEEYPQFPEVKGESYSLPTSLLKNIEQYVSFGAAVDQTRPVLASLLFSFQENGLEVVATDGFRLATFTTKETIKDFTEDILIPVKSMSEVFRMISQTDSEKVEFKVAHELKQVLFIVDGVEIYIRLTEGEYPPYQKIIPPEFTHTFEFEWQELADQIKRAFLFSRDTSNTVHLQFSKGKLTITANSPTHGEYQGEINLAYKGEDLEIAFNALYLLDFLNIQKDGDLIFSMNESLKPAALKIKGMDEYLYIVMPFRAI